MGKVVKGCGWAMLIIVIAIGGLVAFVFLDRGDATAVNDSDLRLNNITVADVENGYLDLKKINITDDDTVTQTLLSPDKKWDSVKASKVVSDNTANLGYFDAAMAKPKFHYPNFNVEGFTFNNELPDFVSYREMARLQSVRAQVLADSGKPEEGFNQAEKIIDFGNKIEGNNTGLIGYLVGTAIERMGVERAIKIVDSKKLTSAFLISKNSEITKYKNDEGNNLTDTFKSEYMAESKAFTYLPANIGNYQDESWYSPSSWAFKKSYYFKPVETANMAAEMMRDIIDQNKAECSFDTTNELYQQHFYLSGIQVIDFLGENYMGKTMIKSIADSLSGVKEKRCMTEEKMQDLLDRMQ